MVSVTLNLSVIAVNVLVLIPLAKCWLNKLPGSVDLGPNVCTSLMVVQLRGTCQVICRLNRRLRRFSQMGYDAPLPFVPGFWVPACD